MTTYKLSDIADITMGQSPESQYYNEIGDGLPFLQGCRTFSDYYANIDTFTTKITKIAKKDDILMSVRAPVGTMNFAPEKLCIGRGLASIRGTNCNHKYLYYSLLFNKKRFEIQSSGTTFSAISSDELSNFELLLPDLSEQERIAKVLSDIDSKIALNKKINRELETMAKEIYDYWFVQFDFPNEDGKPYKSSGGKMQWNDVLKREIPVGWEVKSICSIAKIGSGGTPSKKISEYWNGDLPFFGPTDYESSIFQFNTAEKITEEGLNNCSSKLYKEGDIILTARGSIGKLVIVGTKMAMNQSCYALVPLFENTEYLFFLTKQLIQLLEMKASGSVFKSIISSDIENSLLCIAPDRIILRFCEITKPIFNKIKNNQCEILRLTHLRNELLPLLMNDQARVKD